MANSTFSASPHKGQVMMPRSWLILAAACPGPIGLIPWQLNVPNRDDGNPSTVSGVSPFGPDASCSGLLNEKFCGMGGRLGSGSAACSGGALDAPQPISPSAVLLGAPLFQAYERAR